MTKRGLIILTILALTLLVAACVPITTTQNTTMIVPVEQPTTDTPASEEPAVIAPEPTAEETNKTVTETPPETKNNTVTSTASVTNIQTNSNRSITDATVKIKENELLKLKVNYSDPDKDTVTLSFNKPLDKNGEWRTNYGDAGEYLSTIVASDGKISTTTKLKITVERVNVAPVIDGVQDLTVKEGDVVKLDPKVTDPNKDPVTITISDPIKNGVFKTDQTSAGDYKIKVTATDGDLKTEKSFLLKVLDVNVKPKVDGVPEKLTVKEGEVIRIKPTVSDLDNDKLKVTISDPVGDDGIWETTFTDHGQYTITITVDDGKDKVTKKIDLTVQDQNAPPEIISVNLVK